MGGFKSANQESLPKKLTVRTFTCSAARPSLGLDSNADIRARRWHASKIMARPAPSDGTPRDRQIERERERVSQREHPSPGESRESTRASTKSVLAHQASFILYHGWVDCRTRHSKVDRLSERFGSSVLPVGGEATQGSAVIFGGGVLNPGIVTALLQLRQDTVPRSCKASSD